MPAPESKGQHAPAGEAAKFNLPWHEVLAQVQDAIICADREGTVVYWNDAAQRLWGWPAAEMMGKSVFERLPAGTAREWGRERFHAVLAGEESYGDRHDYRKDGSRVWIEVRSTRVNDADGQPIGILTIGRDITARKQADEKLRQSETMMAAAQQLAHFGSWELDLANPDIDANPLRWSDECYRIFGFEPGAVKVTSELFFSRIPMEEQEAIRQSAKHAVATHGLHSIEHRIILPNGETRFVQEQARVVLEEETRQPVKMVGTVYDITERRKVELELRRSEGQFRSAMEFSAIGMALVALDGKWMEVNQALCGIVGYAEAELLASDFQSITHSEDLAGDLALGRELIAGERQTYQMEKRYIHKQGHTVWVLLSVSLVRDETGGPRYFIAQLQDITERKRVMRELVEAKESAETAMRAKSEFLAMISHEIRTPLNPILGAAQLLMDEQSTPEQQELLRVIHNAGEHLLTLLSDLLDLAKMEAGAASLAQSACRIGELAQGVFDIKHEEIRGKQLALKLELDPALAYAYLVDEPRMRQILLNLVGNAVKFTAQGHVVVRVERLDSDGRRDHLRFNVCDTGIGIAPEHLRKLFEPFYQVDSSSMRQHEGAGLGLAICRRLVEIMGGEIGVESQVGSGSTFWFKVWLERRRSLDEIGTPWPMPLESANHHRVLLASADEQERFLLITALEKSGCEVTRAGSGADLLALFTPGNFDVVIMDERIPDYEWPQLAQAIREREGAEGAGAVSIVLLSNKINEATRKISQEAGVNSLLARPVRQVELLRMLSRHEPLPSPGAAARIKGPPKSPKR